MTGTKRRKLVTDITRQALSKGVVAEVFSDVCQNLMALESTLLRSFMQDARFKDKSWKHPNQFDRDFAKFKRNAIKNLLAETD